MSANLSSGQRATARRFEWLLASTVLGIAIAASCWTSPGSTTPASGAASGRTSLEGTSDEEQAPRLAWRASLPLLPEDKPRSIRYRQAMLRWRTATVAFTQGHFAQAATRFLEVAEALKTERPHPHASTFATARCLAYENAGRALGQLDDRTRARTTLKAATANDPACPHAVRRAFAQLSLP